MPWLEWKRRQQLNKIVSHTTSTTMISNTGKNGNMGELGEGIIVWEDKNGLRLNAQYD